MAKLSAQQSARLAALVSLQAALPAVETPVKGLTANTIKATFKSMSQEAIIEQGMTAASAAKNVGNYFALHTMAQYLYFGRETLQSIIRELYADSRDSTRQYMTRIVTACRRAEEQGHAAKIGTITVQALFDLTKKAGANGKGKKEGDAESGDTAGGEDADSDKAPDVPKKARSIAADLVSGFDALEALAERARAASMGGKAADNKTLLAELARLIPQHVEKIKAGFSKPGQ